MHGVPKEWRVTAPSDRPEPMEPRGRGDPLSLALSRCAGGDRAALRGIYDREAARMLGVALRLVRRRAVAEEVVHDTFLLVWQRAASFDPARGDGHAWLYAILRNRALSVLRGEGRVDLVDDFEPMGLVSEEEGPESAVLRLSEGGRLRRCLDGLDPNRRHVVVLAYVQGLSHGELAGRLGVPLGTVKSWIRRSLAALKECMA
ncbi:RNA polymerase sigma factor [Allostella vacuolata]|nr:RNA polymerase sigma factor [Stella vacuolata]